MSFERHGSLLILDGALSIFSFYLLLSPLSSLLSPLSSLLSPPSSLLPSLQVLFSHIPPFKTTTTNNNNNNHNHNIISVRVSEEKIALIPFFDLLNHSSEVEQCCVPSLEGNGLFSFLFFSYFLFYLLRINLIFFFFFISFNFFPKQHPHTQKRFCFKITKWTFIRTKYIYLLSPSKTFFLFPSRLRFPSPPSSPSLPFFSLSPPPFFSLFVCILYSEEREERGEGKKEGERRDEEGRGKGGKRG